jgi:RNA polymerase sigma factor (sigma-70 family)
MIFENDTVTKLVISWQQDKNPETLNEIVSGSQHLIEAIVSMYNPTCRDDLIQEAFTKLIRAIEVFDPAVATLHTYLTTVIRNACISWLSKYDIFTLSMDEIEIIGPDEDDHEDAFSALTELIVHNRDRFHSLPVEVIDDITETIFARLRGGAVRTKTVSMVAEQLGYDRSIVAAIYSVSIIFLRSHYIKYRRTGGCQIDEFSLLPEVRQLIGDDLYKQLLMLFSGFSIKIP